MAPDMHPPPEHLAHAQTNMPADHHAAMPEAHATGSLSLHGPFSLGVLCDRLLNLQDPYAAGDLGLSKPSLNQNPS